MTDKTTDLDDESNESAKNRESVFETPRDNNDLLLMSSSIRKSILKSITNPYSISSMFADREKIERLFAPSIKIVASETVRRPLDLSNQMFRESEAMEKLRTSIANNVKFAVLNSELFSQVTDISKNYLKTVGIINKMNIPKFEIPRLFICDDLYKGIFESVKKICRQIPDLSSRITDYALVSLFDSKWCPWALSCNPILSIHEILAINSNKRLSVNGRISRIDDLIFSTITERTLNSIRKRWNVSKIDLALKKLALESLRAYRKKNYGSASIVLSALWEGIIKDVSHIDKHVGTRELKSSLEKLSKGSDAEYTYWYYKEALLEECDKKENRNKDVPNRHGNQHSVFNGYPSKKSALNAIFFTDYLISLSYGDGNENNT